MRLYLMGRGECPYPRRRRESIFLGGRRISLSQEKRRVSLSQEESVAIPRGEERVPIPRGEEVAKPLGRREPIDLPHTWRGRVPGSPELET